MPLFRRRPTPSTRFDSTKVDLVTESKDGTASLVIIQDQPWDGSDEERASFVQKVAAYVSFATGEQMTSLYPELRGRPWRIVVDTYVGPPDAAGWDVLSRTADEVRSHGGDMILQELAVPAPPETVPPTIRVRRLGTQWPEGEPASL